MDFKKLFISLALVLLSFFTQVAANSNDVILEQMPELLPFNPLKKKQNYKDKNLRYLHLNFRKARMREEHRLYSTALEGYNDLVDYGLKLIKKQNTSEEKIYQILPFLISAAYRVGVVTPKALSTNMVKLYNQFERYKQANDRINEVITVISDCKSQNRIKITKSLYALLYYARGFNKIALAHTLLKGNIWKNYTIYMPSDIVGLIYSGVDDFQNMLDFSNLSKMAILKINQVKDTRKINYNFLVENYLGSYFRYLERENLTPDLRTNQLSYYTTDPIIMISIIKKRVVDSLYPLLDLMEKKDTYIILERAVLITDLSMEERYLKDLCTVVDKIYYQVVGR